MCDTPFTHRMVGAGGIAFVAGAGAAVGSGVVKVPLAVCIRSVQAGAYPNAFAAAKSIVDTAGARSLFTVSIRCHLLEHAEHSSPEVPYPNRILS